MLTLHQQAPVLLSCTLLTEIQKLGCKSSILPSSKRYECCCCINTHLLLQAKANTNAVDKNKRTPLHVAVTQSHKKVIELFLEAGKFDLFPIDSEI